jgi:hypothetical protein
MWAVRERLYIPRELTFLLSLSSLVTWRRSLPRQLKREHGLDIVSKETMDGWKLPTSLSLVKSTVTNACVARPGAHRSAGVCEKG